MPKLQKTRREAALHYPADSDPNGLSDYELNVFEALSRKDRAREWRKATDANANAPSQPIVTTRL
jgi:hypothetical protein